ncbi:MAG: hypothetical protein ACKOSS_08390 [Planctomycetia bacterium]
MPPAPSPAAVPGEGGLATILLDGGVEARDRRLGVVARGEEIAFEPQTGVSRGRGPFTVEHAAWSLRGEGFSLLPEAGGERPGLASSFRVELESRVFLAVDEDVLGAGGSPLGNGAGLGSADFRPARVFAGRAAVVRDARAPGGSLVIALEKGVRALQQGGRRLQAERLVLELEQAAPAGALAATAPAATAPVPAAASEGLGRWRLAHLRGEGNPLTIEVPDLAAPGEPARAALLSTLRLRHEPGLAGAGPTTTLEGPSELVLEGDVAFAGERAPGARMRASARERMLLGPAPAQAPGGLQGRRIELRGLARLERLPSAGLPGSDLLEADLFSLELRPVLPEEGLAARELPTRVAALGHVRLGGTRMEGETERLVVEGLDTLAPRVSVEGVGTRLSLVGFGSGQRLLGADEPLQDGAGAEAGAADSARRGRAWVLDRLEARGPVAAQTRLGGPTAGVAAWVEGDWVGYERLSERALLLGSPTAPATIHVAAAGSEQHALRAPRIAFERARGRLRAEEGVRAEVWLAGEAGDVRATALAGEAPARGALSRLDLRTDGRIEVDLRVARPGGEPAPEQPQVLRVLSPFTAELRAPPPQAIDRLQAARLDAVLALREAAAPAASAPVARVARPPAGSTGPSRAARPAPGGGTRTASGARAATSAPAQRWALDTRALQLDLDAGELGALLAEGGVVIDSPALRLEASSLSFSRALGVVAVEGGQGLVSARLGPALAQSGQVQARALRVGLDEGGPRWVQAAGPMQAVLVRPAPEGEDLQREERYEFDCPGDVRITDGQLLAERGPSWVRRSSRPAPGAPWADPADIWADRLEARGLGLLSGGAAGASAAGRGVQALLASGPATTFRTGAGADLVEMWCTRIDVDLLRGRAEISGAADRDVVLHVAGRFDSELKRAAFDFRTGTLEDLEAGRAVLRRGR